MNDYFNIRKINKLQCKNCLYFNKYKCDKGININKQICKFNIFFKSEKIKKETTYVK
jgi:hypothetical protein